MGAIFYDLETTDKNSIGQILNFCFCAVDDRLEEQAECSGSIKISKLQLPDPEAILANKINVLEHQRSESHPVNMPLYESEAEAMQAIARFIAQQVERSEEKLALIGFNSSKFDLGYLRTSLIRNGINPYFGGALRYRDLLQAARKLSIDSPNFPRISERGAVRGEEPPRLSLRLETLGQALGLLDGPQSHQSRDDVMLSIKLAKVFRDRFDLDILRFEAYQGTAVEQRKGRGALALMRLPQYDLSQQQSVFEEPVLLLDFNHRSALWVNLLRYEKGEGRRSVQWFTKNGGALFLAPLDEISEETQKLSQSAGAEFKGLRVDNFFSTSTCDIEQDIYRLDMQMIHALAEAIEQGRAPASEKNSNRDLKVLFLRYMLREHSWADEGRLAGANSNQRDKRMIQMLKDYALYRYGGKAQLSKGGQEGDLVIHPTLDQLLTLIGQKEAEVSESDRTLLGALRQFYLESDIYKVAGAELKGLPVKAA